MRVSSSVILVYDVTIRWLHFTHAQSICTRPLDQKEVWPGDEAKQGPVAVGTTLGWVLSGPVMPARSSVSLIAAHTSHVGSVTNRELNDTLKSFWEVESLGIHH